MEKRRGRKLLVFSILFVLTLSFISAMPIYVQPLDGDVGIGTITPQNKLNVGEVINATGNFIFDLMNITAEADGDVNVW